MVVGEALEALAGAALLGRLRGEGIERPATDPGLAGRLRATIEAAVEPEIGALPPGTTIRVTKGKVTSVLGCERHFTARVGDDGAVSAERVQGRVLDRVFAQVASGFYLGADPVAEALEAARAENEAELLDDWDSLSPRQQDDVIALCAVVGRGLAERWPALPGNALVRLQDRLRVPLAGGRLVMSGKVDLALGRPGTKQAGTTLIDVKSGRHRHDDTVDAAFYAVLETLRHHAAPFQCGNYYLRDGTLDLAVVDAPLLHEAAARIAEAARRMVRLEAGEPPAEVPWRLCPWCPALGSCEVGRRHVEQSGRSDVLARLDLDHGPEEDDDDDDGGGGGLDG